MSAALSGVVRFRARTSSDGGALAARSWAGTFGRGAFIFGHMRTHDTAWLFWFRVGELNLLGLLRGADFARTFVRPQPCSARRGKSEHPPEPYATPRALQPRWASPARRAGRASARCTSFHPGTFSGTFETTRPRLAVSLSIVGLWIARRIWRAQALN